MVECAHSVDIKGWSLIYASAVSPFTGEATAGDLLSTASHIDRQCTYVNAKAGQFKFKLS